MIKILLCEQNELWLEKFQSKIDKNMSLVGTVTNGREVQSYISNNPVDVLIINMETKDFSFFEVVKFVKQNQSRTAVVMIVNNKELIQEYFYSDKEIRKLGITETFIKPFPIHNLIRYVSNSFQRHQWKAMGDGDKTIEGQSIVEEEVKEADHKFTSMKATEFTHNNVSIFDLFIRLGKNKYIKILHEGDRFDGERIEKYKVEDKELRVFFKNSDRLTYINFTNEITKRVLGLQKESTLQNVKSVENGARMFIEEIYSSGFSEEAKEEALAICDNMNRVLGKNDNLKSMLAKYVTESETEQGHVYLTTFYAAIICKNLDWVSGHSSGNILMGAFLHDIGKVKLSKIIRNKNKKELTPRETAEYRKHPEYGIDLLDHVEGIPAQVKQIVYQHHELNTGEGFPNGLTGRKIYPLAKIVGFCDFMAFKTAEFKCSPFDVLIKVMEEKKEILLYEPEVIKAFIKGFVNNAEI